MSQLLKEAKGTSFIYTCNDYVVVVGARLWIYKKDGTFVTCHKKIRNPYKVAFLSDNRILVDCGTRKAYILLSLESGAELCIIPHPKLDYTTSRFVVSPDNRYIYDYYVHGMKNYLVRIEQESWSLETFLIEEGLRAIHDIACDEKGIPCLLEGHYEQIGHSKVSQNGIRYLDDNGIEPIGNSNYWMAKWQFLAPRIGRQFYGTTTEIVTGDLYVYDHQSGTGYSLIENDPAWQQPGSSPSEFWLDETKRYTILRYSSANVVIDNEARKVVAQYAARFCNGALVGKEFWIGTDDGIMRKTFPLIEEIPPEKNVFW